MTQKNLKWGVISTSKIGRVAVIPAIQASNNGALIAVGGRVLDKTREFAAQSNIPRFYSSYEALLEDENIDAVYNPLPNSMHREWSIKAAEAGKHILCEKPLALDAFECHEMEAAAKENGVRLMEAFMYRFHPQTEKVLQMVRTGVIGDLRMIRSAFTFRLMNPNNIRLNAELGGGALMDVGCYCVNISRTLAGAEPEEVQAFGDWGSTGVDERMVGTLRFPKGVFAQFDCALTMERREHYEVAGTDANIVVPAAFVPGLNDTVIFEKHGRGDTITHTIAGVDEYRLMVEHFADCLLNDRPFRYSAAEAVLNMQVIQSLYQSARHGGKPISVK